MNWQTILLSVISIVLTALVSWGAERLIALINTKLANSKFAKYLTSAVDVVTRSVKATYQTYVESLKDKNIFTPGAPKKARFEAGKMARAQLTEATTKRIVTNFCDVKTWITNTIESVIYDLKNKPAGENTNEEA